MFVKKKLQGTRHVVCVCIYISMYDPYRCRKRVQQRQFIVVVTSSSEYGTRSSAASGPDRNRRNDGIDCDGASYALPEPNV